MIKMFSLNRVKIFAALVGLLGLGSVQSQALNFGFSSVSLGSSINFDGAGNFSFPSDPAFVATIGGVALEGSISGTYTLGTIVDQLGPNGGSQAASVSGTGEFSITDADGKKLTADVKWVNIGTLLNTGNVNVNNTLNLTGISYTGSNSDLMAMAGAGEATATMTFQFGWSLAVLEDMAKLANPLTYLANNSASTSFSGTVAASTSVPDAGTSLVLLGLALTGLGFCRKQLGVKRV